ncbi:MAG: TonB-dependent receptor [Bacteroidales bacterium]|jgi:iron complex outermembrane receptor protein|nr:TonB-dependent receptor [Bacteroidales bacterium]
MKHLFKEKAIFCFRRWENKSYSAFNSFHKCVKIGVLLVSYSLVDLSGSTPMQTDTTISRTIPLEGVDVNAEVVADVFAPVGRTITQISRSEIEHAPAQTLADLLNFSPGIDLRQRGPFGTQADLSIRGTSFDQSIVLLNGINITDPQTGHYTLNLPIDLESVEKIEILEGPAARIFGNNALGGAINFITGAGDNNNLKISASGGQYGFYKLSLANTLHVQNVTGHVAVSKTASDGYRHNTGFDGLNVFSQTAWKNKKFPIDVQLGHSRKEMGANSFYGAKYPDQYESLQTYFASLKANSTGKIKLTPSLYWRRNYDHYVLIRHNPAAYQNFHRTDVYGGDLTASIVSRAGKSNIGLLSRGEQIYSSNLGEKLAIPHNIPHRATDRQYLYADKRNSVSFFAEQNLYFGKWSTSAGLLLNRNSYTGKKIHFYPGIDVAFYPDSRLKLYASAGKAMRLPTFTDLYYTDGRLYMANPDLHPEQSIEYEAGARLSQNGFHIRANYFYRTISDAIDWIWLTDESVWHTRNLTELHMHGLSLNASWKAQHSVDKRFVRSVSVSCDLLNGEKTSGYISNYALDYLKHKLIIGIDHRIFKKINAHWKISLQHRNGEYSQYHQDTDSYSEVPYEAFLQIDLRIYYHVSQWNIFAEASNLSNQKHQDIGNITLPGIWLRTGITCHLTHGNSSKK